MLPFKAKEIIKKPLAKEEPVAVEAPVQPQPVVIEEKKEEPALVKIEAPEIEAPKVLGTVDLSAIDSSTRPKGPAKKQDGKEAAGAEDEQAEQEQQDSEELDSKGQKRKRKTKKPIRRKRKNLISRSRTQWRSRRQPPAPEHETTDEPGGSARHRKYQGREIEARPQNIGQRLIFRPITTPDPKRPPKKKGSAKGSRSRKRHRRQTPGRWEVRIVRRRQALRRTSPTHPTQYRRSRRRPEPGWRRKSQTRSRSHSPRG